MKTFINIGTLLKRENLNTERLVMKRIIGIDQLRYIFALWVFFTHNGAPPFFNGHANIESYNFIDKLYGWCINGQDAVIGFFIISGLCIHFPNIERKSLDLRSFYIARLLRLVLPLIACLGLAKIINYQNNSGFIYAGPFWTLLCEGLYYIVYPVVWWLAKKNLLKKVIIFMSSFSVILIIIWTPDRSMYFHEIGGGGFLFWKAAVLAFPCWLCGCLIAENVSTSSSLYKAKVNTQSLWKWRLGAIFLSMISFPLYRLGLYFNLINKPLIGLVFSSQFTILLFGFYCFLWIEKEVILNNFGAVSPSRTLERFGLASYSLYLIHNIVIWSFNQIPLMYFPGHLNFLDRTISSRTCCNVCFL
ncbi:acyltransferase family protein [Adhaeribacter radiodurans]|uniref:Acyltransferase n=1 Tax=Adhaeribacter radiodurans TaxID=2745197 RepID=A0A7L7L3P1_9BACT|nr:acyltransferase family protein [Adhaeribacter radiodurans]QMU27427.1 acyltransferase [Adhaeribacter radiodurans]